MIHMRSGFSSAWCSDGAWILIVLLALILEVYPQLYFPSVQAFTGADLTNRMFTVAPVYPFAPSQTRNLTNAVGIALGLCCTVLNSDPFLNSPTPLENVVSI